MYGCEAQTLKRADEDRLQVFDRRKQKSWLDALTGRYSMRTIEILKYLTWQEKYNHVKRLPNIRTVKVAWEEASIGKIPLGSPMERQYCQISKGN